MVPTHGVADQPLVGLERRPRPAGVLHRELHAQLVELHPRPGPLAVERQRHPGGVGEVEGQVVRPVLPHPGAGREHAARWLLERDRDDPRPLGQTLAGAQVERHARPAPVVDLALERDEGLGLGLRCHAVDLAVAHVLPTDHVGRVDRLHRAEDLVLLLADGPWLQRGGRLHRHEGQHLEQVGHHHVAVGAGGLVELGAGAQAERLGHVDLHVVDVVAVPDRLEQPVREPERQDVLRRLLAEEVVDPEDLLLVEHLVQRGVERPRRRQVGAEGLFHDDPAALDQLGLVEQPHHRQGRLGRHAEVVQPSRLTVQLPLGLLDGRPQRRRAATAGHVAQHGREGVPLLLGQGPVTELADGLAREGDEPVAVVLLQRRADDPPRREQAGLEEVQQTRQQLAPRQVTGGAEHDDHVRFVHEAQRRRAPGRGEGARSGVRRHVPTDPTPVRPLNPRRA